MQTQTKYGLSALMLSFAAAGIAFALIATPQTGGAEDMAAYAPTTGSGRVAALPTPAAVPQETSAIKEENFDPSLGWTEFSVGVDAFRGKAEPNRHPEHGMSTELDVD